MNVQIARLSISERRYFIGSALIVLALTFVGFAKTYYLRGLFESTPLSTFLHVHGVVMTAWLVILFAQVAFIAAGKTRWHRQLGVVGIGSAGLVVIFGCMATLRAAAREVAGHTAQAPSQLTVLGLELTQMLLFTALITAGILLRHRADFHKRLMLLATACMLPNPISRLPLSFQSNLVILLIFDGLLLAAVATDTFSKRRLHPSFLWGGLLVLGATHSAFVFAYSNAWHIFASSLVS